MLTPQDVQNKEFTKAVFGGYDMSAVDDFLETLSEDYAALYKDNAILKGKIKVLVEKVEEYRSTEDAMRMALLTAQKMGDDLLAEAKEKSNSLLSQTDFEAKKKMEDLRYEIEAEEAKLNAAKEKTAAFVQSFRDLVSSHSEFLSKLDEMSIPVAPAASQEPEQSPAQKKEEEILNATKEIDSNVSKMLKEEEAPENASAHDDEGEPTRLYKKKNDKSVNFEEDDEPVSPRPKFDFDNLKFGINYKEDEE